MNAVHCDRADCDTWTAHNPHHHGFLRCAATCERCSETRPRREALHPPLAYPHPLAANEHPILRHHPKGTAVNDPKCHDADHTTATTGETMNNTQTITDQPTVRYSQWLASQEDCAQLRAANDRLRLKEARLRQLVQERLDSLTPVMEALTHLKAVLDGASE